MSIFIVQHQSVVIEWEQQNGDKAEPGIVDNCIKFYEIITL